MIDAARMLFTKQVMAACSAIDWDVCLQAIDTTLETRFERGKLEREREREREREIEGYR
jgi:hypothetical protein